MNTTTGTPDIDDFLIELKLARMSPNTIRLRAIQLRGLVAWLHDQGVDDARTATRGQLVRYLSRFSNAETAGSNRAALRRWYRWMAETDRIARDPCVGIPPIRRPEPAHNVIPDDVVLATLAECGERDAAAIVLGRFAGLRASEIAAAHRGYLRRGLDGPIVRLCGKGERWRELPAHSEVQRVLRANPGWVLPGRDGLPVSGHSLSKRLSAVLPGGWTAHSLRHAFATEAYARTRDLVLVQGWLGHARIETTTRYVQVEHDHEAMALMRLDGEGWAA